MPVVLCAGMPAGFVKCISFKCKCFCSIPVKITVRVVVKSLFHRDWRRLRPSKQSSKTLEFRNPTTKQCGTLNTREHRNGNFDVHRCVCCMHRLPHLGQPIKLGEENVFSDRRASVKSSECQVFVVIVKPLPHILCLSSSCHYCWWYKVAVSRQITNLVSPKHSVVTLLLVVCSFWITNSLSGGWRQQDTTDSLMDVGHREGICVVFLYVWANVISAYAHCRKSAGFLEGWRRTRIKAAKPGGHGSTGTP